MYQTEEKKVKKKKIMLNSIRVQIIDNLNVSSPTNLDIFQSDNLDELNFLTIHSQNEKKPLKSNQKYT